MKFLVVCLLVVAVNASLFEDGVKFQDFKLRYRKTYQNQAEEARRFNIFKENLLSIEEHNALYEQGLVPYQKDVNQFTDQTLEEFKTFLTLSSSIKPHLNATKYVKSRHSRPGSIDWRSTQVTRVKNQGSCGACWAFALTGSTEAAYYRKTGNLVSFSDQQLIDCTTDTNAGCRGGSFGTTYPYIETYGLESEDSYPYTGTDDTCKYSASEVVARPTTFTYVESKNEDALADAVANTGPVSVAIDASQLGSYGSGIFVDYVCQPESRNHAILIVGYGSENGQDFWILKNSWGDSWGENGYFRMLRGINECGVAEDTIFPTC